ncbi:MAG: hypothetical protein JEY99_13010 [Spirochaetales bacterium]|nr:hypothetical protein [Spirochaetales bacterium]
MNSIKRKRVLVDRKFQFVIVGGFILSVFIAILIFSALSAGFYWFSGTSGENLFKEYITIHRQVVEKREVVVDGEIEIQEVAATRIIPGVKRWEMIVPALLVNNLIILIVISVIGLFLTHRIAGPLYRIRKDLDRVLSGESGVQIITRKKDTMADLVSQLNKLIAERDSLKKGEN